VTQLGCVSIIKLTKLCYIMHTQAFACIHCKHYAVLSLICFYECFIDAFDVDKHHTSCENCK